MGDLGGGFGEGINSIDNIIKKLQEWIRDSFKDSKGKMDTQFTDFIGTIKKLKDTGDLEKDMEKEENKKFMTKFTIWLKECGTLLLKIIVILYIPICWYLITRKGYSVGGTNLNDFPYRDPNINKKSFNQIAQLYKQSGGAGKFNILGPYREVSVPYNGILDVEPNGFIDNIRFWAVDSFAGSISLLRFILSFVLAANRDITGFDSNSSYNFEIYFSNSDWLYFNNSDNTIRNGSCTYTEFIYINCKIKDYWWPFAGTRLFSGATWIFILMLFGLFAPYSSIIFLIVSVFASLYTLVQQFGLWIFVFGAPFSYMYKKIKSGDTGELMTFMKSILNGVFWVYMYFVLFYPTKIIWGAPAMTGGLVY